ncbi:MULTISPECIES: HD domain-containing protein [Rhodobacterales]|uniref:HD domain-containing protein n=1 Tax=Rhodobacterales TaxID=204455 RepID=UPI00237F5D6A|nr:HD domain-containing protein [Phaeobacter gallaeciensis]MDE4192689.1 HD domain-containing protein [Phaeobacter gallaeciensis]MDE4201214.1 HD domain-containing protein [Phaeobacter gallaeciensis]MDE4205305.1 HD domain-containing protein [Phaeobacter gallaeciensis]MDE4209537.1 HD domain-containing protein [Phaeobacter gallaeciensis]MDE4217812.1 HD domain-containing protein [Phaeobacter gallaeciensis]
MTMRLQRQFDFLLEAEKLRRIERQNLILDGSRAENSAEHSWHLALYALALAPLADPDVNIDRVIRMLLLHDLVEIDAGDHPITDDVDWEAVAVSELAAAQRLFGLLPEDQGAELFDLWREFEAGESLDARFAKHLDHCQPIFQTLYCADAPEFHFDVVRENLSTGRAAALETQFPKAYHHAMNLLGQGSVASCATLTQRLEFLNQADALKLVLRASKLGDGSRRENSAEHSWHIMLYGWILAEHSAHDVDVGRIVQMLLLHDLVEIDAGDTPIHGTQDPAALAALEAKEAAAAERLFHLLPHPQGSAFHGLWTEFEAAESPDAIYAKSIDRVQPIFLNLLNGGGSWVEYDVSLSQLEERVGVKVARGAPEVWTHVRAQLLPWFEAAGRV